MLEQSEQGRERKEMRCEGKEWLDYVGLSSVVDFYLPLEKV